MNVDESKIVEYNKEYYAMLDRQVDQLHQLQGTHIQEAKDFHDKVCLRRRKDESLCIAAYLEMYMETFFKVMMEKRNAERNQEG